MMNNWKKYKLGEVVSWGNGKERPKDKGPIPVYGGNGVLDYTNQNNYEGETVIVGRVGAYCGSVYYTNESIWVSDNALAAKPKNGNDTKFLYYFLQYLNLNSYAEGSTHPLVTQRLLNSIDVVIPPLDEQKRIAGVLSSLDDKIDLLNRENATLEALAETLFRHYFIETPDPTWKEGKMGELIEVKYGKDHKKLGDGSIPVIGSGGIMRYADKALFDGESVLIPRKGSLDNVMYIDEPFWTVDTMFYTKMKIPHVAKFVYQYMKTLDLVNMNVGSAVPSMTAEVLNNIPLEIPSQTALDDYERVVAPFYKKTKSNQQQMQTLTTQRDTILPRLMSGEVKVGGQ